MVVLIRRIQAILMTYKLMPNCVLDIKEALFMGYFGPIGIGAVFYVEHTRHLFPEPGEALTAEENNLTRAMIPVVYWLVVFSIFWHGLSIPALNLIYQWRGVQPIQDEDGPAIVQRLSIHQSAPNNGEINEKTGTVALNNRFSRIYNTAELDMNAVEGYRRRTQRWEQQGKDIEEFATANESRRATIAFKSPYYQPDLKRPEGTKALVAQREYI
jgi:hypothetical protein